MALTFDTYSTPQLKSHGPGGLNKSLDHKKHKRIMHIVPACSSVPCLIFSVPYPGQERIKHLDHTYNLHSKNPLKKLYTFARRALGYGGLSPVKF